MMVSPEMVSDQGTTVLDQEWLTPSNAARLRPAPQSGPMRSIGLRGKTDIPVLIYDGVVASHCHAVELSSTGIVLERGRSDPRSERRNGSIRLELFLENAPRPVRVLARSVRWFGTREAYKFTTITDVDRLTLTEHLDLESRRGQAAY
jgi:hypothetical protein